MTPLSSLVFDLWRAARAAPEPTLPLREAAAVLATRGYGLETVTAQPALINLAALALSGRERLVVHHLRPSVPRLVAATDLHALPDAPPPLLAGPWLVEVGRPERGERLWGETWALGGYTLDGVTYLIGLEGDGVHVTPWRPRWAGGELAEGVSSEDSPLIDPGLEAYHHGWGRHAARFAVVLGVLLSASGAPIRVQDEAPDRPPRGTLRVPARESPWTVRRVTLTPEEERAIGCWPVLRQTLPPRWHGFDNLPPSGGVPHCAAKWHSYPSVVPNTLPREGGGVICVESYHFVGMEVTSHHPELPRLWRTVAQ